MSNNKLCTREVSHNSWTWFPCNRPAKWLVNGEPRCGLHSRYRERKPLEPLNEKITAKGEA